MNATGNKTNPAGGTAPMAGHLPVSLPQRQSTRRPTLLVSMALVSALGLSGCVGLEVCGHRTEHGSWQVDPDCEDSDLHLMPSFPST